MKELLITGTDTDAGKTILTIALAAYWQTYYKNQKLALFKPIQTGIGDRDCLFGAEVARTRARRTWLEDRVVSMNRWGQHWRNQSAEHSE